MCKKLDSYIIQKESKTLETIKISSLFITHCETCTWITQCKITLFGVTVCVFIDNLNCFPLRCAVISSIPAGATYTFKCSGMEGRYVNIVIPGKKKILTLSEVEVYGESFVKYIPSGKCKWRVSNDESPLF